MYFICSADTTGVKFVLHINIMFVTRMKSLCSLKKLNTLKNELQVNEHKSYSTEVNYVQGQSPENKIREYFYFIDHQGMVRKQILIKK